MNKGINIGIVFFSVGILLTSYILIKNIPLSKNGVVTEGTVIQLITKRNPNYRNTRWITQNIPIISFRTADNHEFRTQGCSDCYYIGEKVSIVYDPKNPTNAEVNSKRLFIESIYYLVGFIIFLIIFIRLKTKIRHNPKYSII